MKLHENSTLFQNAVQATAMHLGIPDIFVEKDYWLVTILKKLSESPYRDIFVFKGGTSLSKAFGLIERFSEDVDLALLAQDLSGNQVKSRIDKVSKEITRHLEEVQIEGTTKKWSRFRRTAHRYPMVTAQEIQAQITAYLVLELNAFGNPYPYKNTPIQSFIAAFFLAQNQEELVQVYQLEPVSIQVLEPERTFGEKVLALARASYHQEPTVQLQSKIRHAYDLHILMENANLQNFVDSALFFETLKQVQTDDATSREFQGEWNAYPLSQALIYTNDDDLWIQLAQTYAHSFRPLVYGRLPDIAQIRGSLKTLSRRLWDYDHVNSGA